MFPKINLSLRDSLFLGFCAVFIVVFRMAFRWHLGISGHSMFFTIALLLLARGCVSFRWSATSTGALAGLMALLLGVGKGGVLIIAKFVFPALIIDLSALIWPLFFGSYIGVALVAMMASSSKFMNTALQDWLIGMDKVLLLQHALIEAAGAVFFGVAGSFLVPPVLRKLQARGVIGKE
jgi:hypothetical protein